MEVDYYVCFQLGKTLRLGDAEGFFDIYDNLPIPVKEESRCDHTSPVEIIKEFARQISGLSVKDYEVIERASLEKKLPPSQTVGSELLRDTYTHTCANLISSLLKQLHMDAHSSTSDSGVYSDDSCFQCEGSNIQRKHKPVSPAKSLPDKNPRETLAYPTNRHAREPVHQHAAAGYTKRDAYKTVDMSSSHQHPPTIARQQQLTSQSREWDMVCHSKPWKKAARQTEGPQPCNSTRYPQAKLTHGCHYSTPPKPARSIASWHSSRQRNYSTRHLSSGHVRLHDNAADKVSSAVNCHQQASQQSRPGTRQGCCRSTAFNHDETVRSDEGGSASKETVVLNQQGSASFNHREAAEFLSQGE